MHREKRARTLVRSQSPDIAISNKNKNRPQWLLDANISELSERGFARIADICPPADLDILRAELPRLFAERAGSREGKFYDMLDSGGAQATALPTLLNPSNYAPVLRRLECLPRAAAMARWLLGEDAVLNLEHAILKPAMHGAPTPWHQDEAYRREPNFQYRQVTFWIPLHDVTDEAGCLRFVAGSNHGEVLAHRSYRNDAGSYALECVVPVAETEVTVLPLAAGSCSMHSGRTLHGAGPNLSARHRFAYILEYEAPPLPLETRREFPWHAHRAPAVWVSRGQWLRRGGLFVEASRRLREGLFAPRRLQFEWRRSLRVLKNLIR